MSNNDIQSEFESLPPEGQRKVLELIALLQERYACAESREGEPSPNIAKEDFIGMWREREEMKDSVEWVRSSRAREWIRHSG